MAAPTLKYLQRFDGRQYGVSVAANGDVLEDVAEDAAFVDDEGCPPCPSAGLAFDSELRKNLPVRISEKITMKVVLLCEALVGLDGIPGQAHENRPSLVEVSRPLTEVLRLDGSAGRVVHRVRPQDDMLAAAEVREI